MRLRFSPTSPFVRKVRLGAAVLGIPLELEPADTLSPTDSLRRENPLGKIPTLIDDAGEEFYDSRVILAYLDHLAGGDRLIPTEPKARFDTLRREALGDGIMDATVLLVYEGRFRPEEKHEQRWLDHQTDKVHRGLAALKANPPAGTGPIRSGDISVACALAFIDFRMPHLGTDKGILADWLDGFAARCPGFEETRPR